jgi:DNA polymerase I-like protein with 3'-5' exonuclease and polymerase domains
VTRLLTTTRIVTDDRELEELVDRVLDKGEFAFDVETVPGAGETFDQFRLDPRRNEVIWTGIATQGLSFVVPSGHPHGEQNGTTTEPRVGNDGKTRNYKVPLWTPAPRQLPRGEVFGILEPLFYDEDVLKIGCNIKFDLETILKYYDDEVMPGPFFDVQIAAHMLNENYRDYRLGTLNKRELGFVYDKKMGEAPERYGFRAAARYNHYDAKSTWLLKELYEPQIEEQGLDGLWRLEMDVLEVLLYMEQQGALLDVKAAEKLKGELGRKLAQLKGELYRIAGREVNLNSSPQKQALFYGPKKEGGFGLKVKGRTKGGAPSTARETLEKLDHPFIDTYLEHEDVDKIHSTYLTAYLGGEVVKESGGKKRIEIKPSILYKGKLHANFKQHGTVTGRFSCVSGATILPTSRGDFRFDSYLPEEGDLVRTHTGALKPVLRKIYKGTDEMLRVCLSNGSVLECTREHRLLTPTGWRSVGDMTQGDEVLGYVGVEGVRASQWRPSAGDVPRTRQADSAAARSAAGDDVPQRAAHREPRSAEGATQGRAGAPLLQIEDAREPDERKEWLSAPRPQGGHLRRPWLPAAEDRQEVRVRTSVGDGRGARAEETARLGGGAPHRRGQDEQRLGQPRGCDEGRPPAPARQTVSIREIASLGTMGVWDVEVAGDHSYLTQGFYNHNCSEPNLQNIPRPGEKDDVDNLGTKVRGLFIAPPGHSLVVADYGQIEYIVMAHFSRDPVLVKAFDEGVDLHKLVAGMVFGIDPEDVTKTQRTTAKNTNFAVAYGAGDDKVASMSKISLDDAVAFRKAHRRLLPRLYKWTERTVADARRQRPPHVTTLLGRKRRLPALMAQDWWPRSEAERQAVNAVVQGSAADIIKLAMVRGHRLCDEELRLSLSVHDELVLVVPDDRIEDGQDVLNEAMLGPGIQKLLSVPMKIDMHTVQRWSDAK